VHLVLIISFKMPKIKYLSASQLRAFIQEFGQDIFFTDGTVLLCNICNVKVSAEKRFSIEQHLLRDKHILRVKRCELQKEVEEKNYPKFYYRHTKQVRISFRFNSYIIVL